MHLIAAVLFMLFLALPPATVRAQGTSGLLPRQITVRDAGQLADRLSLSIEQRRAFLAMHDRYALEFEDLFEQDVQWLLLNQDLMQLSGGRDGLTAADFFARRASVLETIERRDRRLFDELANILADGQLPALEHDRAARARERWTDGALLWFVSSAGVDLVGDDVVPWTEETAPALTDYDSAATPLVRRLHDDAIDMYTGMDRNAATAEPAAGDTEEVAERLTARALRTGADLARVQRRALASAAAVLPPEQGAAALARYGDRRFRELRGQLGDVTRALAWIQTDPGTNAAGRRAVGDLVARLLSALLDACEREESASPLVGPASGDPERSREAITRIREQLDGVIAQVLEASVESGAAAPSPAPAATADVDALEAIDAALGRDDLRPWQREALAELRAHHAARAAELDAALDAVATTDAGVDDPAVAGLVRHDRTAWYRFQRMELEARTLAWVDAIVD